MTGKRKPEIKSPASAHGTSRIRSTFPALCILAVTLQPPFPASSDAFPLTQTDRQDLTLICNRPYPPSPELYEKADDYRDAREAYYKEASVYVSVCIERWIGDTARRYQEMFDAEVRAYREERQAVMDEMRAAAGREY